MPRTPEEKAADDALTAALEEWLRAYKFDGSADTDGRPRVLTDYVVMMATQGWTAEGDGITGYPYCLRDGMVPHYRSIGLAHIFLDSLNQDIREDEE